MAQLVRSLHLSLRLIKRRIHSSALLKTSKLETNLVFTTSSPHNFSVKNSTNQTKDVEHEKFIFDHLNDLQTKLHSLSGQSPLLKEIKALHELYPQHILLVQVGSFYELYDIATPLDLIADLLNLRIAKKKLANEIVYRFAGFPMVKVNDYVNLLLENGYTVALADQVGTDMVSKTKQFIRKVVRILTPGTVLHDVQHSENHFLLCITRSRSSSTFGLAWVDVSTGEFFLSESGLSQLCTEIARIQPIEILCSHQLMKENSNLFQLLGPNRLDTSFTVTLRQNEFFDEHPDCMAQWISKSNFNEIFTKNQMHAGNALLSYLKESFPFVQPNLIQPLDVRQEKHMILDATALHSLEIVKTQKDATKKGSLLHALDKTVTSVGKRLLASRLKSPLMSIKDINHRLDLVQLFYDDQVLAKEIKELLHQCKDLEKFLQRLHFQQGGPSDFMKIVGTLNAVMKMYHRLDVKDHNCTTLKQALHGLLHTIHMNNEWIESIPCIFIEEAAELNRLEQPGYIQSNISQELDALRQELTQRLKEKDFLMNSLRNELNARLSNCTEFTLKFDPKYGAVVDFMKTNILQRKQLQELPKDSFEFIQKAKSSTQCLIRYHPWTDLSVYIQTLNEQLLSLERDIFLDACKHLLKHTTEIVAVAQFIAILDVSICLAMQAKEFGYVRPRLVKDNVHDIKGGRHPVVEQFQLLRHQTFIKNDCSMDAKDRIWLLTGANMGGKSTFLRQCAIMSLLAQMGSFVPADDACLGIVDRIFSRVGSSDNLNANQSTFMVEMQETSVILKEATPQSFVILDEVGRGTSSLDGLSLSFAILSHLQNKNQCRGIFATHFHELAKLLMDASYAQQFPWISCHKTTIFKDEETGLISCLYKIQPGIIDESHGIQMAHRAGKNL